MSEADEQTAVVEWCALKGVPCFHIPNGGSRNKAEAANLKRQGVKAGVPDLCIPVPNGFRHGLFIEMKSGKGKPTEKQVEWLNLLRSNGYSAWVCYGAESAIECISEYLADQI